MQQGYLCFEGIECVYSRLDDGLIVTPKNESDIRTMFQCCHKTNFFLEYQNQIYKKSVAYVKQIVPRGDNSFRFVTKYNVSLIGEYNVTGFTITGDDIDVFFSPSKYFFRKISAGESLNTDLLYDKIKADDFIFTYSEKRITATLYYGDILEKGVASDLKIHPHLRVEFDSTSNINFIFGLYETIVKFLKLVRYQQDINLKPIELFGPTETHDKSILGIMYSNTYITKDYRKTSDSEYEIFKPYINQILQLVSDDQDFSIRHFPLNEVDSYKYDVQRYLSIFASFEYECNKNSEEYLQQNDEPLRLVKNDLLNCIQALKKNTAKDIERSFLDNARNRISQLGTQYGQEKKIINAYYKIEDIFKESMTFLFPHGFKIKELASRVSKLRAKIAHDNLYRELTDEEARDIRFMEVLSYILLLKRAGLKDETIELVIGAVFHCNFKYMDFYTN